MSATETYLDIPEGWEPVEPGGAGQAHGIGYDIGRNRDLAHERLEFENLGRSEDLIEVRFRHKDGSWRVLEAVARNVMDDPVVGGVLVVARDVTGRKELEQ